MEAQNDFFNLYFFKNFGLKKLPDDQHGTFHDGDSYLILKVKEKLLFLQTAITDALYMLYDIYDIKNKNNRIMQLNIYLNFSAVVFFYLNAFLHPK